MLKIEKAEKTEVKTFGFRIRLWNENKKGRGKSLCFFILDPGDDRLSHAVPHAVP
jgi:hypothetical protein